MYVEISYHNARSEVPDVITVSIVVAKSIPNVIFIARSSPEWLDFDESRQINVSEKRTINEHMNNRKLY